MATQVSEEQRRKDEEDFMSGFDDEMKDVGGTDFEDEMTASAATPEAPATEAAAEEPAEAEAEEGQATEEAAAEPVGEETPEPVPVQAEGEAMPAGEPSPEPIEAEATGDEEMSDVPPEDVQAFKSWRGRLKKREEELAAREAALSGAKPEEEPAGDGQVELVVEAEVQPEGNLGDALNRLKEDFGDEFVEAIMQIAKSAAETVAAEKAGGASAEAIEAVKSLMDRFEATDKSEHMEYITDAHPDVFEITESQAFKDWISDKPDMQACCEHGTKRQVVKMLNSFKEATKEADKDEGLDDLTVAPASSGVVIPSKKGDSFEAAWGEF